MSSKGNKNRRLRVKLRSFIIKNYLGKSCAVRTLLYEYNKSVNNKSDKNITTTRQLGSLMRGMDIIYERNSTNSCRKVIYTFKDIIEV